MTDPKPLSTLLGELQAVRAEGVALSSTLPDAPTTKAQRALAAKHGTPRCMPEAPRFVTAAEWAVRAYPALVALQNELDEISRDHAWHPSYRNAAALAHNKIASILALAKEEKE